VEGVSPPINKFDSIEPCETQVILIIRNTIVTYNRLAQPADRVPL
jgi:hypothetical protein